MYLVVILEGFYALLSKRIKCISYFFQRQREGFCDFRGIDRFASKSTERSNMGINCIFNCAFIWTSSGPPQILDGYARCGHVRDGSPKFS